MFRISVRRLDAIKEAFKKLPAKMRPVALVALTTYFLGNDARGLRHYPPPRPSKYVRTYRLKHGWYMRPPQGTMAYIANPVPYSIYVQGQPPARHMAARGWRGHMDVIKSNMKGAIRAAQAAIKKVANV